MEFLLEINKPNILVLILIIMEDTHGEVQFIMINSSVQSLNPYYNGRYSWRHHWS